MQRRSHQHTAGFRLAGLSSHERQRYLKCTPGENTQPMHNRAPPSFPPSKHTGRGLKSIGGGLSNAHALPHVTSTLGRVSKAFKAHAWRAFPILNAHDQHARLAYI